MALPTSRPNGSSNNDDNKSKGLSTSRPSLSQKPEQVRIELTDNVPRRIIDDEIEVLSGQKKRELDFSNPDSALRGSSGITSYDAINLDYDENFARFQPDVVSAKEWLQEHLNEKDLSVQVAEARKNRGSSFYTMKRRLENYLLQYFAHGNITNKADSLKISSFVVNEILGLGPIEPLWQDNDITEIMVNGPDVTYVEISGRMKRTKGIRFRNQEHLLETVQQMIAPLGRTLDVAHPYVDGRLPDGSRINATHPIIGPGGPFVTIRRFPESVFSLRKLTDMGSMTADMAQEIGNIVFHDCSVIISGGTGSGKQLADWTLLPTPTGWTTMGAVQPGDFVLDADGAPTLVTGKFQDKPEVEAFTVTFSDGNKIVADADHNWFTFFEGSGIGEVRTTAEIRNSLLTSKHHFAHAVKVAGPAQYEIDNAYQRTVDAHIVGAFLATGVSLYEAHIRDSGLDIYDTPRIPEAYLLAPVKDRRELLEGILNGYGSSLSNLSTPHVSLHVDNNDDLANDMRILIQSLGYVVHFTQAVSRSIITFSLAPEDNAERHIISVVEYMEPVTMHCITVDNDAHLYQASDAFITTHNTSMLNALSGCVPNDQRIITIEDNLELRLHPDRHVVALESRKVGSGSSENAGDVTIRNLVMNSLRMRPTRLIIGEVRDGTAYDMLQAMNTGHEGSMTTIHANDPFAAIERLSNLIAQVGELSSNQALSLIASGVDIIIQVSRFEDGSRRVASIAEIPSRVKALTGGQIELEPIILWEYQQTGLTEDEKIIGEYVKVNDPSESFRKKHRLDKKRRLTLEEIFELSDWDGKIEDSQRVEADSLHERND